MSNEDALAENNSQCWACNTSLSKNQKICLECNSWQNFRKYINVSNTTLSLLIALISVLGAVGPKVSELFTKPEMTISLTKFDNFLATIEVFDEATQASVIETPLECDFVVEVTSEEGPGMKGGQIRLEYKFSAKNGFNKIVVGRKLSVFNVKISGRWHEPDIYNKFDNNDDFNCQIDNSADNINSSIGTDPEFTRISVLNQNNNSCFANVVRDGRKEKVLFDAPEIRSLLSEGYIRGKNGIRHKNCAES
ncbi:MAG: hypothetical protein AAF468_11055 [Pseudomonadota bacterium]